MGRAEAALASMHALREAERQGAAALDSAKAELQAAQGDFLTVEAVLLVWIRDSLLLEIIMLVRPINAIKVWQLGH